MHCGCLVACSTVRPHQNKSTGISLNSVTTQRDADPVKLHIRLTRLRLVVLTLCLNKLTNLNKNDGKQLFKML